MKIRIVWEKKSSLNSFDKKTKKLGKLGNVSQ